jgi:hypothetical protein
MNRREALSAVGFLVGGTVIGAQAFLAGCADKPKAPQANGLLTSGQISFLDEVGETILPTTASSPGAKAAKVGEFMDIMVKDCYSPADQKVFLEGITTLDNSSKGKYDAVFVKLTPEEKHQLLLGIDKEASAYNDTKAEDASPHYYTMMKQLTLLGYFSSDIGSTKALAHVAVPGHYEACVPLKPGQKAWS